MMRMRLMFVVMLLLAAAQSGAAHINSAVSSAHGANADAAI